MNRLVALGALDFKVGKLGLNEPRQLDTLWQQLNPQKYPPKASLLIFPESRTIKDVITPATTSNALGLVQAVSGKDL
jgi:hypothetical protein